MQAIPPLTAYHHQNTLTQQNPQHQPNIENKSASTVCYPHNGKPPLVNQPTTKPPLVSQLTKKPPPVPNWPIYSTPTRVDQETITKTMTIKPKTITKTKTKRTNFPPPLYLTPKPTNPNNTTPIMMEQCKGFIARKMAIFWARLKKQSNMSAAKNSNNLNHPYWLLTVPFMTVTNSEKLIAREMPILQANLKKIVCIRHDWFSSYKTIK